jgi:hypothetical protein
MRRLPVINTENIRRVKRYVSFGLFQQISGITPAAKRSSNFTILTSTGIRNSPPPIALDRSAGERSLSRSRFNSEAIGPMVRDPHDQESRLAAEILSWTLAPIEFP